MNALTFIPGAIAGLGLMLVVVALLPTRPQLRGALERIGTTTSQLEGTTVSRQHRIGTWVQKHLPDWRILTPRVKDFALVGTTPAQFYWDKTLLAVLGFVGCSVLGLVMQAIGSAPAYVFSIAGLGIGAALWFAPDQELRRKSRESRLEFARAVAVYLELVAAERRRGASMTTALESAAKVGNTWVFHRIREELGRARLAGTPAWTALGELAVQIDVPELGDISKISRLSGEEGAQVYEPLRSRGRALRVGLLNDEHTRANEASERMSLPLTALAFIFVGIIMTPLVLNLLE